jgi:glucosamine-6-phosphate deaminase
MKAASHRRLILLFVGIGRYLAFNDPPADFQTEEPYIIVSLDEACRRQQVSEGWFTDVSQVPRRAISMSVRQIEGERNYRADARRAKGFCSEGVL